MNKYRAWEKTNKIMYHDIIPISENYIITDVQGILPEAMAYKTIKGDLILCNILDLMI